MARANAIVGSWMREAGMTVRMDAAGNLVGRRPGTSALAGTLLLGSHLDTVRDAGAFDGPLGVITAIALVQRLREEGIALPFALDVLGFADEEGLRFGTAYLGSRAVAGTFDAVALGRARRRRRERADRAALASAAILDRSPARAAARRGVATSCSATSRSTWSRDPCWRSAARPSAS